MIILGGAYLKLDNPKNAIPAFEAALRYAAKSPAFYCEEEIILSQCAEVYQTLLKSVSNEKRSIIIKSLIDEEKNSNLNAITIKEKIDFYRENMQALHAEISELEKHLNDTQVSNCSQKTCVLF